MHTDYATVIIADLTTAQWPLPLAKRFAENFTGIDAVFTPALQRWCEEHTVMDVTIYGCSLTQIMQARGEHFWVCIRNMNAIYTNTGLSETQRQALMHHLCVKPVLE
ncbi:MAG: hypothetical protein ACKO83_13260 [Roseiflexaceae bacterium]